MNIGETFHTIAQTGPLLLALGACALAGLVSFASPCVVPLVPGYLSYLAGLVGAESPTSAETGPSVSVRLRVAGAAGLFVLGFTVVFVLASVAVFGMAGALRINNDVLQRVGGVVTIVMGLVFVGLVPMLQRDVRMTPRWFTSLVGAPVLGAVFALGWTPCIGPTLAGVLSVATSTEGTTATRGTVLIIAYCLGLGLPFILLALGSTRALRGVGWLRRHARTIQIIGGTTLVLVGIALLTGMWGLFVSWIRDAFVTNTVLPDMSGVVTRPSLVQRAWALVRNTWRGLTSMRTALALLFLLALGAIPGAVLPQRSLNRQKVDEYILNSPTLGQWMDRAQLFDVFGSFWFTSIYALLFISLIGCIVPRAIEQARTLGAPLVEAPRNLSRLPKHFETTIAGEPEVIAETARKRLRGWRTTIHRDSERSTHAGEVTVSAEKGYLHELGNLVFHVALVGLLASIAAGKLVFYEGNVIVIADGGPGFCSTAPAAFDTFRAGNLNDGTGLTPICIKVDSFKADYLDSGQAEMFTSKIQYQAGEDLVSGTWRVRDPPGQPSVASRRRPGLPAGTRLRADVHRHLPERRDPHRDAAVGARGRDDVPLQRRPPLRSAGRHVPRCDRTT